MRQECSDREGKAKHRGLSGSPCLLVLRRQVESSQPIGSVGVIVVGKHSLQRISQ
jgi:hypothetical protein